MGLTTPVAIATEGEPIDPRVRVGHVHLNVADLERSLQFYCGVLGFGLHGLLGDEAAFLAAGSYHHHLAINTWESRGGLPPPKGSTGLHHVAFVYPTRAALGRALGRLRAAAVQLTGASDHGGTEAIYLRDPDGNGVELYWDRPEKEWPRNPDGSLKIVSNPLDVENLAAEGSSKSPA
ncbi:VOC family protein [Bradyrhizobium sp. NBAIM20]|nr:MULTISPECIES: VOC family protein [Bradyrhizobium]MCA1414376.1 VOC family protein [Bradyrhizobium sp. NBAIM20]MCA1465632.1 VOC family protein [Bradyrhizobium sp. NBAIM18]MCA1530093.1 VOC family protein [Bradyrhizobium yuanmingense]PWE75469.1 glyoxalase [Bradyrhizobium sp. SUTN9-2]